MFYRVAKIHIKSTIKKKLKKKHRQDAYCFFKLNFYQKISDKKIIHQKKAAIRKNY